MIGPEARRIAWGYAREEFDEILARWCRDEEPVDIDDLNGLAVYTPQHHRLKSTADARTTALES